jgi:hypothetical protein
MGDCASVPCCSAAAAAGHLIAYVIGATDVWYCDVGPRGLKHGYGC